MVSTPRSKDWIFFLLCPQVPDSHFNQWKPLETCPQMTWGLCAPCLLYCFRHVPSQLVYQLLQGATKTAQYWVTIKARTVCQILSEVWRRINVTVINIISESTFFFWISHPYRLVLLEVHCAVINVEYLCLVLNIIQSIKVDMRSTENMQL